MATRPVVPRATGEGSIGTAAKHWGNGYFDELNTDLIAPPSGSTNNSVGAEDRPWKEGHFDSVKLNGGDLGSYLAESTGYGIVSGCEPSISGLTVTVGAGVVHLADGTRKEISSSTVTLDAADSTNPRIDLVYIDSTGAVAKVTGTAAASPSVPSVPSGGISVCNVSVAAGATTGTVTLTDNYVYPNSVKFLFPANHLSGMSWDCSIIATNNKVLMIDSGVADAQSYLLNYLLSHGINKVDYFILSHYHTDHTGNIINFLNQSQVDFSKTKWYIPSVSLTFSSLKAQIITALQNANATYYELTSDVSVKIDDGLYADIMCCSNEFNTWVTDYYTSEGTTDDLNAHSLYTLVRHNNVNALYTGDGFFPETKYVYQNYDLPKINILKLPHHSVQSGLDEDWDTAFYKVTATDYAIVTSHYDRLDDMSTADKRFATQFAATFGADCYYTAFGEAEFVSNGKNVVRTSNNYPVGSRYNENSIAYVVDASYSDGNPDGSPDKPFASINAAIDALPKNTSLSSIIIYVKAGTYAALNLVNLSSRILFSLDNGVTIGNVWISDCSNVMFSNGFIVKQFLVGRSNVTIRGNLDLRPDSATINIENIRAQSPFYSFGNELYNITVGFSKIKISTLTIDGDNLPSGLSASYWCGMVFSEVYIDSLVVQNDLKEAVFGINIQYNSNVYFKKVTLKNLSIAPIRIQTSKIFIDEAPTISSFTASEVVHITSGKYFYIPSQYGTTANRPDLKFIPNGFYYWDTTLKHLLIKIGSGWIDTTTGNAPA